MRPWGTSEQALSVLPHLSEQRDTREQAIDLRLALRTALQPSGDHGRILAYLREAEALAETLDDPRRLGQVSVFLSVHFRFMGAYDQAIIAAQRTLALATPVRDVVLQALANRYLGTAYQSQGDYRRAIDCLRQAVAFFDGAQRRERFGPVSLPAVTSRAYLAWCHAELGMFPEGTAIGEEGLRIAEAVAHPGNLMSASHGMGMLSLCKGDLPRALPLLERAVGLCQDTDLLAWFPLMAAALGTAYTLSGRVADAVPLLMQAMEQSIARTTVAYEVLCRLPLARRRYWPTVWRKHTLAERTLTLAHEPGTWLPGVCSAAPRRDCRASCSPDIDQAAAHYRQALALAEELGMRPLVAHCHRGLGMLYLKLGRRAQARPELSAAIDLYRAMDMTFWLPQTEAALAQVEGR